MDQRPDLVTHTAPVAVLAVPATDPHRIAKALASGADEVVIDLEDAVPVSGKDAARAVVRDFDFSAAPAGVRVAVRVNAARTPWCHRDLEAVAATAGIASVVVPKVESRADLGFVERLLDGLEAENGRRAALGVQALVETAAGVAGLADIVSAPDRLAAVIIGYADLAASLGRTRDASDSSWAPVRQQVLVHCRAAGIAAVDGPYLGVGDDEAFRDAVGAAAGLGFDAKWVIHPRQVATVLAALRPDEAQVLRAEAVLEALAVAARSGRGAAQLDGELIDEAMALAARRTLARRPSAGVPA